MTAKSPKVGLVLGSGSARGWAHIGVINALAEQHIVPDIVCGSSTGAFVGAAYARGTLAKLETWVSSLTWQEVVSLLDVSLKSGLIKGDKLMQVFVSRFVDCDFEALPLPFAIVATNLETGHEVWLREGNVARAVRASIALPGLMMPVSYNDEILVDGGLVNPVPVSLCRAMGADIVIAVDLGSALVGRRLRGDPVSAAAEASMSGWTRRWFGRLGRWPGNGGVAGSGEGESGSLPSLVTTITSSIDIMQVRIARSRLAGEPADVLLAPRLAQLGLMDYHRGKEAIAEGYAAVRRMLPLIEHVLKS